MGWGEPHHPTAEAALTAAVRNVLAAGDAWRQFGSMARIGALEEALWELRQASEAAS